MTLCFKCNRMLAANGNCLYCGTTAGMEVTKGPPHGRRRPNWLRRILLIALGGLLIHFLFFTATGRGIVRPLLEATGLSKYVQL